MKNSATPRLLIAFFSLIAMMLPGAGLAQPFSFVAIGDAPYRVPEGISQFEHLRSRINGLDAAFTIHIGDIKNGSSVCEDAHFRRIRSVFDTFERPLIYTPGDNEWTDCHRADNGGYDPLERLSKLRETFYPSPVLSLGRTPMRVESQGAEVPFKKFIENVRWEKNGVWFATIHVVGSNNNLQRNQAAVNEYIERNAANLSWIGSTFALAAKSGAKAVVIAFQADPWFHLDGREDQRSGFTDTIAALKSHALKFGKPVLIIHGDQHRLLIDKPLQQSGRLIHNATRLMVYGDREVHGVLVTVDPGDVDVFGFRSITVPENLPVPGGK
jgi:hypothetical protein